MARKKKKKRKTKVTSRMGPAQNLRPAGAHKNKKRYNRRRSKAEIEAELDQQE